MSLNNAITIGRIGGRQRDNIKKEFKEIHVDILNSMAFSQDRNKWIVNYKCHLVFIFCKP